MKSVFSIFDEDYETITTFFKNIWLCFVNQIIGDKYVFLALEKDLVFGKLFYSFYTLQEFMKVLQVLWVFLVQEVQLVSNQRRSRAEHGYCCLQLKRLSLIVPFPDENALIIREKPILG